MISWLTSVFMKRRQVAVKLPPLPAAPILGDWTKMDMENWKRFLNGETGQKLVERLRAVEYSLAVANAGNTSNTVHAAGLTTGYNHCFRHITSLSAVCADSQTPNEGTPGEASANETAAQKEQRELAELIGRMSP